MEAQLEPAVRAATQAAITVVQDGHVWERLATQWHAGHSETFRETFGEGEEEVQRLLACVTLVEGRPAIAVRGGVAVFPRAFSPAPSGSTLSIASLGAAARLQQRLRRILEDSAPSDALVLAVGDDGTVASFGEHAFLDARVLLPPTSRWRASGFTGRGETASDLVLPDSTREAIQRYGCRGLGCPGDHAEQADCPLLTPCRCAGEPELAPDLARCLRCGGSVHARLGWLALAVPTVVTAIGAYAPPTLDEWPHLPAVTAEERAAFDELIAQGESAGVNDESDRKCVRGKRDLYIPLTVFMRLRPNKYMEDDGINSFVQLLNDREERRFAEASREAGSRTGVVVLNKQVRRAMDARDRRSHWASTPVIRRSLIQNTFFYSKFCEDGTTYRNVMRWTWSSHGINVFDLDKFLVPINIHNSHWVLAVVDVPRRTLCIYDSLKWKTHEPKLRNIVKFLCHEAWAQQRRVLDPASWTILDEPEEPVPLQSLYTNNCGLFTCSFMDSVMQGKPVMGRPGPGMENAMVDYRVRLAAALLRNDLNAGPMRDAIPHAAPAAPASVPPPASARAGAGMSTRARARGGRRAPAPAPARAAAAAAGADSDEAVDLVSSSDDDDAAEA